MKKTILCALALCAVSTLATAARPNTLTKKERKEGWVLLFNGKDFSGWRGNNRSDMPANWKIDQDAMMVFTAEGLQPNKSGGGDILYDKKFKNFEVSIDWKISKGANSGIFINAREIPGKPLHFAAPEIQVIDDKNFFNIQSPKQLSGSLYDMIAPNPANAKPYGEWNTIVIRVENGHVTHTQNGVKVVEYDLWSPQWDEMVRNSKFAKMKGFTDGIAKEGYIGLQDHGWPVWFRNIKIREL